MLSKGLVVGVILLFIGIAFSPSIDANVSKQDDFVEFDVELCGLDKKHTVSLTQQEADEVDLLFEDIEQKLSEVETREEAEIIFKDAVIELDEYDLLGGLSVRQVKKLISGNYQNKNVIKNIENQIEEPEALEYRNVLCLIAGATTYTYSNGLIIGNYVRSLLYLPSFLFKFANFFYDIGIEKLGSFFQFLHDILISGGIWYDLVTFGSVFDAMIQTILPISLGSSLGFGGVFPDMGGGGPPSYHPAEGWVFSLGILGIKYWNKIFWGQLHKPSFFTFATLGCGASCFSGIKISGILLPNGKTYFLGSALNVHLGEENPFN